MNFQQLRIIKATSRYNFNLTDAANSLHTSQSGVSKHIKDLEEELGVQLYVRKGKRLLGFTEPGKLMLSYVERMLQDAQNIKNIASQYHDEEIGELVVATTHTQARYVLPAVVSEFKLLFPKVRLRLHQASPDEIVEMLLNGEADIGIATEALANHPLIASFDYHSWHHGIVVPAGHPLAQKDRLTLEDISNEPVITYHEGFTGRAAIDKAFQASGLTPEIVMTALDADVIKSYVELGLGIGIIASVAFHKVRDNSIELLSADHLFDQNQTRIGLRKDSLPRLYALKFIGICVPSLDPDKIFESLTLPG